MNIEIRRELSEPQTQCVNEVERLFPHIFSQPKKSYLYVGGHPAFYHGQKQIRERFIFSKQLRKAEYQYGSVVDVIEIWPKYCEALRTLPWIRNVHLGDIATIRLPHHYDIVIWWSGPEHVPWEKFHMALSNCESFARELVLIGTPIGRMPQGSVDGNPHQEHKQGLYPMDFAMFGYNVFGKVFRPHYLGWCGRMIAWKEARDLCGSYAEKQG